MSQDPPFATPAVPGQPDPATSFAEAFRVGQGLARDETPPPAAPPSGQPMGAGNASAEDVSDLAAHIDATPPALRAAVIARAQQNNEQLAHVLIGLKGYPPDQRLAIAQHLAQTTGIMDPAAIGPSDVNDQGLDAHLAQAMAVEQFLKRETLYASIPAGASPGLHPLGGHGAAIGVAGPASRLAPTGAGHLTDAQLSTSLGY